MYHTTFGKGKGKVVNVVHFKAELFEEAGCNSDFQTLKKDYPTRVQNLELEKGAKVAGVKWRG